MPNRELNVIIFGASGMVGQGVLHECLLDSDIANVLSVARAPGTVRHPKLREIIRDDFFDFSNLGAEFTDRDACFFCLGVSSAGMSEEKYTHLTFDLTMAAATAIARRSPNMAFMYVSGAGTDSTEKGRAMWARVKGKTENTLLAIFPNAVMFRPGFIQPMDGVASKTPLYRAIYSLTRPLVPVLRRFPKIFTMSTQLGRAMIQVARAGAPKRILESNDINTIR